MTWQIKTLTQTQNLMERICTSIDIFMGFEKIMFSSIVSKNIEKYSNVS